MTSVMSRCERVRGVITEEAMVWVVGERRCCGRLLCMPHVAEGRLEGIVPLRELTAISNLTEWEWDTTVMGPPPLPADNRLSSRHVSDQLAVQSESRYGVCRVVRCRQPVEPG